MTNFFSKCSKCINMHQNASKCMQNEMCKCFVHENIKKWVYIAFKGAKISKLLFTICIRTPSSKKKTLISSIVCKENRSKSFHTYLIEIHIILKTRHIMTKIYFADLKYPHLYQNLIWSVPILRGRLLE